MQEGVTPLKITKKEPSLWLATLLWIFSGLVLLRGRGGGAPAAPRRAAAAMGARTPLNGIMALLL